MDLRTYRKTEWFLEAAAPFKNKPINQPYMFYMSILLLNLWFTVLHPGITKAYAHILDIFML